MTAPAAQAWGLAPLRVEIVGDRRYRVTGGTAPHAVERDAAPGTWRCDCRGFGYRHRCTHIAAVLMFREHICAPCPPGLAAIIDPMTERDVLDLLGPPDAKGQAPVDRPRSTPPSPIEAEVAAILDVLRTRQLELEAELAGSMGQRKRTWWLRACAAARRAP